MAGVAVGDGSFGCNLIAAAGGYRVSFDRSDPKANDPKVIVRGADGNTEYSVKEHPRVEGLCATVEQGEVVVYLSCMAGDTVYRRDVRLATGKFVVPIDPALPMGPPGAKGDTGPQGPPGAAGAKGDDAMAITGEQMDQLSRLTAERVWDVPPRADNNGLPETIRFGTRPQQDIAVMFINQAFLQAVGMTADEAAANLQAAIKAGTYVPKTQP